MNSSERRQNILGLLKGNEQPVSASTIANQFQVSRQIIVGDIALLRASGVKVSATPRGYVIETENETDGNILRTIACKHNAVDMAQELYTIVDLGGAVLDVIVEHTIYGQLVGQLHLFSRYDIDEFLHKVSKSDVRPLSDLTGGIHLHTIRCKDESSFTRIANALTEKGILLDATTD